MVELNSNAEDPDFEWRLRLRSLNESAACLPRTKQNCFRPTHTIWPYFDKTTKNNAFFVANYVLEHQQELVETINAGCLVALVSANVPSFRKTHILNLTIKWLLQNPVEAHTLHHILQSIHAPHLTLRRLGRVRLGIYIYLTTSELINYYDIFYEHCGSVCIRRKSHVPEDPAVLDDSDLLKFCKRINWITDNYYNPCWPEGTYRKDPNAPIFRKGKVHIPIVPIVTKPCNLLNPCFKWDFNIRGTPFTKLREPVAHFPQAERRTILSHDPRLTVRKYYEEYHQEEHQQKVEENTVEPDSAIEKPRKKGGFDFSPLPKKLEKITGRCQKSKMSIITKTTSSGYGSIAVQSDIVKMEFEKDFKNCDINTNHQKTAKIPVNTRPGGAKPYCQGYQPKNHWNKQESHYYHQKDNYHKKLPNSNSGQQGQPSDSQEPSISKSVSIKSIEMSVKPILHPGKSSEKPRSKFSFDPTRNIIQLNFR